MKFSSFLLIVAAVAIGGGCRHTYEAAPPPYYCQPAGCGCAPAPAYNPCANPCATPAQPYLPRSTSVLQPQPQVAPANTIVTPAPGTYAQPGNFAPNQNPTLPR
jgi:hypothetical protein